MTLIVSVISADGIVIAGDSLSSLNRHISVNESREVTCPDCGHKHTVKTEIQGNLGHTTFSHTEKVFPFLKRYGIGVFGSGLIGRHSVNFLIRSYEHYRKQQNKRKHKQQNRRQQDTSIGVTQVAEEIGVNLHSLLKKQLADEKKTLTDFPESHIFLGFQIVGYDDLRPRTIEVLLSRDVRCQVFDQLGCYASGSKEVVEAIWKLNETRRETNPIYEVFSLKEAIDYVDFLISSTIAFQRFSPMTPNVGGDIDIALVRPFDDIQWIRQKPLGKLLQGGNHGTAKRD